ncbi:MAG TPA: hypothetical protein VGZ90_07815 [Puia sp.]|jgi:hypothetical protein|nr:hypothetical protein [Puia sp.]
MKRFFIIAALAQGFLMYCNSKPVPIPNQLENILLSHLKKTDSTIILDSFRVLRMDKMVEKLGRIIDDTIYKRELYRVQDQLANAIKFQKHDSIEFYQGEVNYMLPQIDSLTKSIAQADTTKKFGLLVSCWFQISKNNMKNSGLIFYFLDQQMTIRNSDMIDSTISLLSRSMH